MFFKSKILKIVAAIREAALFVAGRRRIGSPSSAAACLDQHFLV